MTQQTNLKNNPNSSILKETRIAKGLTLEIVHEATKIPMDALRAIEEGYSTRILTPFYYRGFMKIYSEFLGLKVADVLKEYNVQTPEVKTIPKYTTTKPSLKPAAVKSVPKVSSSPNRVAEQLAEFWRVFWTPQTKRILLRVLAAVVALFVLVKMVGCVAGFIKSRPKHPKTVIVKNNKKTTQIKKEQPKIEVKKEEDSDKDTPKAVSSETANHKVTLAVHASKNTSIQVKADGKIVFQMTMKKGTVENWEADNQIELSGKNIGDLEMEINGKDVSSLASANRRAKTIVITKDGLTVKK